MNKKLRTIDLTLIAMFVSLMAIGANITSIVPLLVIGGVPITLQTFFAILSGLILGSRLGAISMLVYTFVGLVGVPVFSKFSGGPTSIISPTFGFIISYILVAFVVGKITEKKKNKVVFIIAALAGMIINYLIGTNWMYLAYKLWASAPEGFTYKMAWLWMIVPMPKDVILSILAGLFALRMEKTFLSKSKFKELKRSK